MKIICEGIELSDAVMKVVKACSTKTTNPILECIKISADNDVVELIATDGEIAIEKKIRAEVLEGGAVCVPGKYFSDFIKKLENCQITLATENEKLNINYGESESSLQVLSAEDFPAIDLSVNENRVEILAKDLKELIAKTTFCCAQDDSRPVLKGCLVKTCEDGRISFTALDGYRMAVCRKNILSMSGNINIICPGRTLNEIGRMLGADEEPITVYVQKNMLLVSVNDTVLTSRLYEGDFVNVNNIVPREFTSEIVAEKEELDESVERAAVMARTDKNSVITFDIREEGMNVSSITAIGRVDESLKVMLEGKDVKIALNCKYVSECLGAIADEKVRIGFNGAVAPCVVTPVEGDSYLYLILPVRTTA
ncbi:MAG TPA: DNA polymerase III subunit beta [Candidatus Borkfalkia excrementigallinarum]|uniref:Beta sliding clamp n=1 Tax=Candidatus Borkfalkia excrementigallinarum TaxID=2838506 RepID=A0A9D1ZXV1_9FIRM|nr:DNA polymerase III subunit beta [Candidatus Borkfalkia excrementigallinarum]